MISKDGVPINKPNQQGDWDVIKEVRWIHSTNEGTNKRASALAELLEGRNPRQ